MTGTNTKLAEAASQIDRGRLCSRSCTGTPHSPEGTGSMEISFVTSKNVNGKEVQAFGGYGFSDWKFHGQRQKFYICWWGPWLIPTVRYNRWVMPCWSCLFEGEAKEANFDVSVRSRPGDVGQWFAPHEVEGRVMSKPVVRTQRKKKEERRSKH